MKTVTPPQSHPQGRAGQENVNCIPTTSAHFADDFGILHKCSYPQATLAQTHATSKLSITIKASSIDQ
eukprot:5262359-Amphidinium_carterae.1